MDGMPHRRKHSWEACPDTLFASFGDIPGSLCSPADDWPRPFRNLSYDAAWERLAATSNLHSIQFDASGRRADALNFQPCAETPSQDRYAVQQINIQGRIWTLSAVFDGRSSFWERGWTLRHWETFTGHLGIHTVEHVAHHMPIIVREHLEVIAQKHGARPVPPPLIADMFAMAIRAFDDAIANDVLNLFPGGLSSLSELTDVQIQEVLDDQFCGGHNYTMARLCMYGTTALVTLVDPDHKNLWLANLGDCQGRTWSVTMLYTQAANFGFKWWSRRPAIKSGMLRS
jgi:pyruvate dehydrogenase phosphatase